MTGGGAGAKLPLAMILAGDIGGTRTILALFDEDGRRPAILETYRNQEHASFHEVVGAFVRRHRPRLELACLGVAGPVRGNRSEITNLPWVLDGAGLAAELGIEQAWLLNDLEALAHGISVLQPEELSVLQAGAADTPGPCAVIAAGTGLGQAGLTWDGKAHRPFATQGGHVGFAPQDELELELARFLLAERERLSWECVVSGPGLVNLYRFFRDSGREQEPAWLAEALRNGDPAPLVAQFARDGRSALCASAMALFVKLYGAAAGDLALAMLATGGVYIGGGIAAKNLDPLRQGGFMEAFLAKGRMRSLLETIPVRVILNDRAGLLGAAHYARRLASRRHSAC